MPPDQTTQFDEKHQVPFRHRRGKTSVGGEIITGQVESHLGYLVEPYVITKVGIVIEDVVPSIR